MSLPRPHHELRDPETAADATMFAYVTDDPPCLSNQELDDTFDDYYYHEGAYYYVKTANDQE